MSAELFGEGSLVSAATDCDSAEAHAARVLNSQMAETADALDGDGVARTNAGVAHCIKDCDASAEQRRGVGSRKVFGNRGDGFGGCDHVFRISAVEIYSGDFLVFAIDEVTAAAVTANEAMGPVPAYAHALAGFPE